MKKTTKRVFGGLMVVLLIATIGAVVVSANPGFFSDLTDEQKEEMKNLRESLRAEGKTRAEIREEMRNQLEEYGVELPTREEMLDKQIEFTEQKLEILKRIKELVEENPEITQEEIRDIISEEFDLEIPEDGQGMMNRHRGHFGPKGPCRFMTGEETE